MFTARSHVDHGKRGDFANQRRFVYGRTAQVTSTRHRLEIRKAFFDFDAQTLRLQGVDGRMPMHTVLPRK